MDVLLIAPPLGFETAYPLRLASLAASLKQQQYRVDALDLVWASNTKEGWRKQLARSLQEWNDQPPQVVVLESSIRNVSAVRDCAAQIKEKLNCPIAICGSAAAISPGTFAEFQSVDLIITGDAEDVLATWLAARHKDTSLISGLWQRKSDGSWQHAEPVFRSIKELPAPDRSVFPLHRYSTPLFAGRKPQAAVEFSRGCSLNCRFCPTPHRYRTTCRYRDPERIVEELQRLKADFGIMAVAVEDEQPLLDRKNLFRVCELLRRNSLGMELDFPNGVWPSLLDHDMIDELASAGCRRIAFGIESASPRLRKEMNRPIEMAQLEELLGRCRKHNILTTGYFMVGLPTETPSERLATLRMACSLPLDYSHLSVYWPSDHLQMEITENQRKLAHWRSAAYTLFYLSPRRAARLLAKGELALPDIPKAALRLFQWRSGGAIGGGGW